VVLDLSIDPADGAGASWLHRHTEVMERSLGADGKLAMKVRLDPAKEGALRARFKEYVVRRAPVKLSQPDTGTGRARLRPAE
jgi:hypothetical protein